MCPSDLSGWEDRGAKALEDHLLAQLHANGWPEGRACVLVVEPEIEAWLRFDSVHLQKLVRERARRRQAEAELLFSIETAKAIAALGGANELGKPRQPKEVLARVLEVFGVQRSNSLYQKLAADEGLKHCKVESFQRLVRVLRGWFPAS